MKSIVFYLTIFSLFTISARADESKYSQSLRSVFERDPGVEVPVWVYFSDKGPAEAQMLEKRRLQISDRALKRRAKVMPGDALLDEHDLPPYRDYVNQVREVSGQIRITSRWLNAVTTSVNRQQLRELSDLNHVIRLDLVKRYTRHHPEKAAYPKSDRRGLLKPTSLDYGASLAQITQINVPPVHDQGINGDGVLICLLDNGFRNWKSHSAFDSMDVVATWDFINNDESVDESNYPGEGSHGTQTLSVIGGYAPGNLIGPAYKASYMLGKTEIGDKEIQIEEDHWVAGVEWAERNGADIVSSSLGYIDWYTWEDMDGETAVTTRHADMAVQRGVLVVNSAGNEGRDKTPNTLIAPADGKYVLAIGAVDINNQRVAFSSFGPTADGRIKPDLAAMGSGVRVASPGSSSDFSYSSGTSFSCPLVAGVAALILSEHPDMGPLDVIQTMRSTASQSSAPDNLLGWGIVNARAALNMLSDSLSVNTFILKQNFPNPFNNFTIISYTLPSKSEVSIRLFDSRGRLVRELEKRSEDVIGSRIVNGEGLASGVYFYQINARDLSTGKIYRDTKKLVYVK